MRPLPADARLVRNKAQGNIMFLQLLPASAGLTPVDAFGAAKYLSDHVRIVVLADRRGTRAQAARTLVAQADGDVPRAAAEHNSSVTVLRDLIRS